MLTHLSQASDGEFGLWVDGSLRTLVDYNTSQLFNPASGATHAPTGSSSTVCAVSEEVGAGVGQSGVLGVAQAVRE